MEEFKIKYPECEVKLTGRDGNAFAVVASVRSALRVHLQKLKHEGSDINVGQELETFMAEAYAGDYDNVLQTCMKWVSVS